jgi:uncharacterized protein YcbX
MTAPFASVNATVVGLWRYPVKSMGGETIEHATLAAQNRIEGDREWGVFDAATGKLLSAKSVGPLLTARACWTGDDAVIELPGGARVVAGSREADVAIGSLVGREVALRRAASDAQASIDCELDDGGDAGPGGVDTFETKPGLLYDSQSTLHLVGTATLSSLDRDHAAGGGDVRRFRPNVVVDGLDALAEDAWIGRDVRLGGERGVLAYARKRTGRCVIISRAQPGVAQDRALIRFVNAQRANGVGIYLDPRGPGELAVGDRVAVV